MSTQDTPRTVPIDIYLVGLGIMSLRHVTREAEDAIRVSHRILFVDATLGVREYLQSHCSHVESLLDEYQDGRPRIDTYRAMAVRVLEAALDDPPVTFAVYGHPSFFVYPSSLVRAAAQPLGLRTHVVPGVSAIDTVLADLDVDAGTLGLQVFEATSVLLEQRELDAQVPLLLMQVDALESGLFTVARSTTRRFQRLQDHLLKFYPADHEVRNVQSSTHPLFDPRIDSFPLSRLAEQLGEAPLAGTLYLEPVSERAVVDESLAAMLNERSHLNEITATG